MDIPWISECVLHKIWSQTYSGRAETPSMLRSSNHSVGVSHWISVAILLLNPIMSQLFDRTIEMAWLCRVRNIGGPGNRWILLLAERSPHLHCVTMPLHSFMKLRLNG